jgi:hypothetical protein
LTSIIKEYAPAICIVIGFGIAFFGGRPSETALAMNYLDDRLIGNFFIGAGVGIWLGANGLAGRKS